MELKKNPQKNVNKNLESYIYVNNKKNIHLFVCCTRVTSQSSK